MKKNLFLKLLATTTLFANLSVLNPINCALALPNYNTVKSPSLNCTAKQRLINATSTTLKNILATIEQADQTFTLSFDQAPISQNNDSNGPLPALAEGEKYFVVPIDVANNKIMTPQYLELKENADDATKKHYETEVTLPYYCDVVDCHVYKQGVNDSDFEIISDNFIGRTKILTAHDAVYSRGWVENLKVLKKDGTEVTEPEKSALGSCYFNRLTPNIYSIECQNPALAGWDKVGKIVLPDDQKDLMPEDHTIIPDSSFTAGAYFTKESGWTKAAWTAGYFNFYLPPEVTNFTFQIYNTTVTGKTEDILYQFKINLNRS